MATIKVFDVNGVKELKCFDTLDNVAYLDETGFDEPDTEEVENDYDNPF